MTTAKDSVPPRQELAPPRSRLILERVLGLTALSNAMVAVNPVSGELAYAAGCIVVIYNLRRNKQVRYYRVDKSVACLCFSPNGQFLAIGEKGYLPAITIWDGTDGTLCAELQRHQYGVACMAFSKDGRFLLTAGLVHDRHIYAWELKLKQKETSRRLEVTVVACAVVEDKILAADYCEAGSFFVTVGERHFKYWFLDESGSFLVTGRHVNELPELQHRDAELSAKASATFTGVGCGNGVCELKTFAVTADGTLCCFGTSGIMERLVSLEVCCGNAVSITESYVAVGGSSGVVRLFDPSTLEYRVTLPFPPAFGTANKPPDTTSTTMTLLHPAEPFRYPAVIAVRISGSHVIVFYSDRSIFIYGTANPEAVTAERSFLFHSGGVRGMDVVGSVKGITQKGKLLYSDGSSASGGIAISPNTIPTGTFVTCSDDNTVRLWNLELHRRPAKASRFEPNTEAGLSGLDIWKNTFSQELLRVVYNDQDSDFMNEHCTIMGGTCSHESSNSIHSPSKCQGRNKGFRAVAIRPDQKEIASGDQEGNVVVIPIPLEKPIFRIDAHSSKVQCLAYSGLELDEGTSGTLRMASGGKDRLIQLYDCKNGHTVVSTLESHSSPVATVTLSRDGKVLLSCGEDNSVSVSGIGSKGEVLESKSLPFNGGKVFDMTLLPDNDSIVASCNNRLEILSASTGKFLKTHHVGEQRHIAVCPANYCVAMSGSLAERTIHIVDIISGETLATGTGHGEAITALKFTPDCRRLLSASTDGCIFVWRLADDIQSEIKAHLPLAIESQGPLPAPPRRAEEARSPPKMPPPAPPISGSPKQKPTNRSAEANAKPPTVSHNTKMSKARNGTPNSVPKAEMKSKAIPGTKTSPRTWKGKGVAVPGPKADIPMEEWMRTRQTAKPTIHVIDDDHDPRAQYVKPTSVQNSLHGAGSTLSIDRSQTPNWARTVLPTADSKHSAPNPSLGEEAGKHQAQVGGKWGYQIAESLVVSENIDGTKQQKASVQQVVVHNAPDSSQTTKMISSLNIEDGSPRQCGQDELSTFSADMLCTKSTSSTSLALEREQLEKRKKQVDTANAVAAMNTRLSQLGLLRQPNKSPQPRSESKPCPSPVEKEEIPEVAQKSFNAMPTSPPQEPTKTRSADRLSEQDQERPSIVTTTASCNSPPPAEVADDSSSSDDKADKATDELVNQALSALEREKLAGPTASDPIDVQTSLSTFTSGYNCADIQAKQDHVGRNMAGCEVDASLSAFTSGFVSELVPVQVITGSTALVVKEPNIVASSLSTFTAGYTGQGVGESVNSISAVDASISNFTYGYTVVENTGTATTHQSIDVPVDISLSTFTSGYGNQKPSAVVVSSPGVQSQAGLVKASLSAFTAGYCAEVSPMSTKMDSDVRPDTKSTDLQDPSPSGFTLDDSIKVGDVKLSVNGQPTSTIEITPEKLSDRLESPGVEDIPEAVATSVSSICSGLNQSLEDATTALEEVFALHKPEDNADSKLQEIHRLITALRASVNDFIVPDKT